MILELLAKMQRSLDIGAPMRFEIVCPALFADKVEKRRIKACEQAAEDKSGRSHSACAMHLPLPSYSECTTLWLRKLGRGRTAPLCGSEHP